MPVGVYERNEKHNEILANARKCIKNRAISEAAKVKIGLANSKKICFNCDYCGNEMSGKPSHHARRKRHFCSRACHARFRSELLPKEEQAAFGTGMSLEERERRKNCRRVTHNAVKRGDIKIMPCEKCGSKAQMHHLDYSDPFKIMWLCFKHHTEWHKSNPELMEGNNGNGA